MLIDTHAHVYVDSFIEDLSEVVLRAKQTHVEKVILPNIDVSTIELLKKAMNEYPDFFLPMMGLHPTSVKDNYKQELDIIYKELNSNNEYVAIGEIGIDLYWDNTYIKQQVETFETQLRWSIDKDLPVAIHSRNSYKEIIASVNKIGGDNLRGVFHSFSGDAHDLKELLNFQNFYIGINGIVTFKNSNLRDILKDCPIQKIVLETDSPYLSPAPYRGKRNEPMYLEHINKALSDIYAIDPIEMAQITKTNAMSLFDLSI
jgi:TatD DNase family protein